ncbi:unnamed protein product [Adineta steineri]|uniref:Ferric reductase NAD binding domain-containing protein n=1 Tax=Adineta steineri TaxID=433720 RepID=A0A820B5G7_9BILA|nr:unnamed protein product [Adineta steineri]CAF4201069.1 unnamed protein product [Adineta steineri]
MMKIVVIVHRILLRNLGVKIGHDVFTALKSKTHLDRPNWNELLQSFKSGKNASMANDVGVFFCGPPSMGIDIRKYCMKYQFRYFKEKF